MEGVKDIEVPSAVETDDSIEVFEGNQIRYIFKE